MNLSHVIQLGISNTGSQSTLGLGVKLHHMFRNNDLIHFCMSMVTDEVFVVVFLLDMSNCYDIKPVRKEEGKFYWKIPLGDDNVTREK